MWDYLVKRENKRYVQINYEQQSCLDSNHILVFDEDYVGFLFLQQLLESHGAIVHRSILSAAGPPVFSCLEFIDLIIVRNTLPLDWMNKKVPVFKLEYRIPVLFISEGKIEGRSDYFWQFVDLVVDSGFDSTQIMNSVNEIIRLK